MAKGVAAGVSMAGFCAPLLAWFGPLRLRSCKVRQAIVCARHQRAQWGKVFWGQVSTDRELITFDDRRA
jgi:hypothetical protein